MSAHTADAASATGTTAASKHPNRVLNLLPSGDGFVSTRWRAAHFGKALHVTVGIRHRNKRTTFLRFRLPAGGRVLSAELTMTRVGYWAPQPISARLAHGSGWSERSLTDHTAPRIDRWLDTTRVTTGSDAVHFTVTAAFAHQRTATIAVIAPVRRGIAQFASRQAPHGRPVLHVVIARHAHPGGGNPSPPPTSTPPTSSDPTTPDPTTPDPTSSDPTAPQPTSSDPTTPDPTASQPTPPVTSSDPSSPTPSPSTSTPPACSVSAILVPSCGRWWGVAPLQFQWSTPLDKAVAYEETVADRPMDIVHVYHVNGQLFPTSTEISVATAAGHNRLLLINWKPATDMTWAQVAAGGADQRIDAEAAYLKTHFPYRFFLAIYHEPEDNVNPAAGSGMTAADYAAMYRHVVLRLRADGVHNAITVMDYMGFNKWAGQSWFPQLWPGSDVVDWIGLDPYGTANPSDSWTAHNLNVLVNRQDQYLSGYYHWATTTHPGKPIMLCEWGVQYAPNDPTGQADFFASMDQEVAQYPDLKALVYYDVPQPPAGSSVPQTTVSLNPAAEAAFRSVANSAPFVAPRWHY